MIKCDLGLVKIEGPRSVIYAETGVLMRVLHQTLGGEDFDRLVIRSKKETSVRENETEKEIKKDIIEVLKAFVGGLEDEVAE